MDETQILRQAREAIRHGDKAAARSILLQFTQVSPDSEVAWLWLSAIAESPERERVYLTRVLEINPRSDIARKYLDRVDSKERFWGIVRTITVALIDGGLVALVGFCTIGAVVGVLADSLAGALVTSSLVMLAVVGYHFTNAQAELSRTGEVTVPRNLVIVPAIRLLFKGLTSLIGAAATIIAGVMAGALQPSSGAPDPSEVFPSGYRRRDYHDAGATDGDIEFWGLDQPGAPGPQAAGWVIMEIMDELDRGGDGWTD